MKIKIFLISILSFFAFSSCSESLLNSLNGALDNATKNPGTNNPNPGDTNNPGTDNPGVTDPDNPNTGNPNKPDPDNPGTGDTGDSNSGDSGNQNPVIPTPKPEPSCKVYDPNDPDRDKPAIPENATELEKLSLKYPYWNISVKSFGVWSYDGSDKKPEYEIITVAEKKRVLELLSLVRFVINTPEFADNFINGVEVEDNNGVISRKYNNYANDRRKSGKCGTIEAFELLDEYRFLQIINQRSYPVGIIKRELDSDTGAEASLGSPLYVYADDEVDNYPIQFLYFPSTKNWATHKDFTNTSYSLGIFFHEMIHNLGFNHQKDMTSAWRAVDPAYHAQYIMANTYNKAFQEKYKNEIEEFRTFYERLYPEFVQEDTVYIK